MKNRLGKSVDGIGKNRRPSGQKSEPDSGAPESGSDFCNGLVLPLYFGYGLKIRLETQLISLQKTLLWPFRRKWQQAITAFLLVALVSSIVFVNFDQPLTLQAATYTFTQSSWTGGASSTALAFHATNQSGWTGYDTASGTLAVSNQLSLNTFSSSTIQTLDSDFNAGAYATTTVASNSVSLATTSQSYTLTQTDDSATTPSPSNATGGFNNPNNAKASTTVSGTGTSADVRLVTTVVASSTTDTTSGSEIWTAPTGVNSVTVELWGGGGSSSNGNGAGGGAYAKKNSYPVTPGNSYTIFVGAAAQDSYFINNSTVLAKGGANSGAGGQASASIGDVKYSGGSGAVSGTCGFLYFGGGGGAAGASGNGGSASGAFGGSGGVGGGAGGNGHDNGICYGTQGQPGNAPGGGGGATKGGAPGKAILSYEISTYASSGAYTSYIDAGVSPTYSWNNFTYYASSTAGGTGTTTINIKVVSTNSTSTPSAATFNTASGNCNATTTNITAATTTAMNLSGGCTGTNRYLWYQTTLYTSTDKSKSPTLDQVLITTTTTYPSSGSFTSAVLDTGQANASSTLNWNATNTASTSISMQIRGDTSSSTLSSKSWCSISSGGDIFAASTSCVTPNSRYFQYQATLSTSDVTQTPTLNDVTLSYTAYNPSGTIISSPYYTSSGNVMGNIQWSSSTPAGTTLKFQVRTAPDNAGSPGAWTDWLGPDGATSTYFMYSDGSEDMPAIFQTGDDDEWFQYQAFLASDGSATPVLSEVRVAYVVNAPPQIQNISAVQNADGTVSVSYEVRDIDTDTGPTPGSVGIVLQYCNDADPTGCADAGETNWETAATLTGTGTSTASVATSTFAAHTIVWNAKADYGGYYFPAIKLRIRADDSELANNFGYASVVIRLDTKNPTNPVVSIDRSQASGQITFSGLDDSTTTMKYALDFPPASVTGSSTACFSGVSDFVNGVAWTDFTSPEMTADIPSENNDDVRKACVLFKDSYDNVSSNFNNYAISPRSPESFQYYDVSNASIGDYRLFLSWGVPELNAVGYNNATTTGFNRYEVYRCAGLIADPNCDPLASSTPYLSIIQKEENYFSDLCPDSGCASPPAGPGMDETLRYCYRVRFKDTANSLGDSDYSKWSSTLCVVPGSGQSSLTQNVSIHFYPTGDENVPPAKIYTTQATIKWQTVNAADGSTPLLADSTVWWRVASSTEWTESYTVSSYVSDHAITIPGKLLPGTEYEYKVVSVTPWAAADTKIGDTPVTFQTKVGPVIRTVTATVLNNTASINWETLDADMTPVSASSQLYYSTAVDSEGNLSAPQSGNCPAGYSSSHACTIGNLLPGDYYFYVYSVLETDPAAYAADTFGGDFYRFKIESDVEKPTIVPGANPIMKTDRSATLAWQTTNERARSWVLYATSSSAGTIQVSTNFNPDNPLHNPYADYVENSNFNASHIFSLGTGTSSPLAADTAYYYRLVSQDVAGNVRITGEYSFTTLQTQIAHPDLVNPGDPTDANEILISDTQALIKLTTNTHSLGYLCYGTETIDDTEFDACLTNDPLDSFHLVLSSTSTLHSFSLGVDATSTDENGPLTASSTYYYRIKVIDSVNQGISFTSSDSANISFATQAEANFLHPNLSAITNVTLPLITDTQAAIAFDTDQEAKCHIDLGLSAGDYSLSSTPDEASFNINHVITLSGLTADTAYYFRIDCADNLGNSPASPTVGQFTTLTEQVAESEAQEREEAAREAGLSDGLAQAGGGSVLIIDKTDKQAPAIAEISVSDIMADSAVVRWTTDEEATSIVNYELQISNRENLVFSETNFNDFKTLTKGHAVRLQQLSSENTYKFSVASADSWGNISYSEEKAFTTLSIEEQLLISSSTPESQESSESMMLNAAKKAIDMIKAFASSVSLNALETTMTTFDSLTNFIPPPIMSGEPKLEVTADSATVSWTTDKETNSLVAIASADKFGRTGNAAEPYPQVLGLPNEKTTTHRVTIIELKPDTTYHYQLRSKAPLGPQARSGDFTFTTKKQALEITDYSVKVIDTSAATFSWSTNDFTDSAVEYIPYRNNVLAVDEKRIKEDKSQVSLHEITVSDLDSGMTYQVKLAGKDAKGNAVERIIQTYSTGVDTLAPEIIQVQTDQALSQGKEVKVQTVISWNTNEPSTSRVWFQKGFASASSTELSEKTAPDMNYTKKHGVVITKFEPGSIYTFRVESADSSGNTALSRLFTVLTPRQKESVFQVIMKNFESIFGWMNNIK